MAEVKRLLGTTRLLTLTGTGGCGQDEARLEVARSLSEEYPDGVWLVELAALADPALVPQAVALALGIREVADGADPGTLVEPPAAKSLLLVLDNCEHLLDACARLADALLRACPSLRVLATSREALGIDGETVLSCALALACPTSSGCPLSESSLDVRVRSGSSSSGQQAVQAELRAHRAERPGGRRGLLAARRDPPRARACRRSGSRALGRAGRRATRRPLPPADGREPNGAQAAADASGDDRLELRPALRAREGALPSARRLRGRLDARGGRGGLRGRDDVSSEARAGRGARPAAQAGRASRWWLPRRSGERSATAFLETIRQYALEKLRGPREKLPDPRPPPRLVPEPAGVGSAGLVSPGVELASRSTGARARQPPSGALLVARDRSEAWPGDRGGLDDTYGGLHSFWMSVAIRRRGATGSGSCWRGLQSTTSTGRGRPRTGSGLASDQGDLDEAEELAEESLEIARETGDAEVTRLCADRARARGQAAGRLGAARALWRRPGAWPGHWGMLGRRRPSLRLGGAVRSGGDSTREARACWEESARSRRVAAKTPRRGKLFAPVSALLGFVEHAEGNSRARKQAPRGSLPRPARLGDQSVLGWSLTLLGYTVGRDGDHERGTALLRESLSPAPRPWATAFGSAGASACSGCSRATEERTAGGRLIGAAMKMIGKAQPEFCASERVRPRGLPRRRPLCPRRGSLRPSLGRGAGDDARPGRRVRAWSEMTMRQSLELTLEQAHLASPSSSRSRMPSSTSTTQHTSRLTPSPASPITAQPTKASSAGKSLRLALEEAIEALKPRRRSPPHSTPTALEATSILRLRYLEALDVRSVLKSLALGRSEYYRDQKRALEAVAAVLRERWGVATGEPRSMAWRRPSTGESASQVAVDPSRRRPAQQPAALADQLRREGARDRRGQATARRAPAADADGQRRLREDPPRPRGRRADILRGIPRRRLAGRAGRLWPTLTSSLRPSPSPSASARSRASRSWRPSSTT